MLKNALLGFLNYSPMTGYALKQQMDGSTSHFWHAKLSQIYSTLKVLEEDGMISSIIEEQETRPDRRVYSITESGQQQLCVWLNEPLTETGSTKSLLLLKLFFSAQLDKKAIVTQLRLQRQLHEQGMIFYQTETKALIAGIVKQHKGMKKDALFWEATRRFGELCEETYVRWLDETIQIMEEKL